MSRRTPLVRTAGLGLLAALLLTPNAGAADQGPAVTNGGYLRTQGPPGKTVALPLKHTDVRAEVSGVVAQVAVTQHFHNPFGKAIEAVYVFPLPHRAAVHAMTIHVGTRVIRGVVKKRAEAQAVYDKARSEGRTAALLEQERDNVFTQSIANILPGDQIRVELSYVEALVPEGGRYEFVFPMVVGPRYVSGGEPTGQKSGSGWGTDTTRVPDASRITPPLLEKGLRPGHDISVQLTVHGGSALRGLQVVSHRASVAAKGASSTVTLDRRDRVPNKDFVVRYRLAGDRPEATLLSHRDAKHGHFLLMIQPKAKMLPADIAPREYVFVVDNSGSMYGTPLAQAQAVVRRLLSQVRERDTFQIIKFAGMPDQFAPAAVAASPTNVAAGIQYVASMRGGGGTEFLPALRLALEAKKDPSRARIVLFVTDGYIGYEAQVLRFLREHGNGVNLFALGVGSSVNRMLIDGMARIGGGEPYYILHREKPQKVVDQIFSTLSRPALTSVALDFGGLKVKDLSPSAVRDLFADKPIVVVGRYDQGGAGTVTVRGRLAGAPFEQKLAVTLPDAPTSAHAAIPLLWARQTLIELTDLEAVTPTPSSTFERTITQTALRYGLVSKYTAFVAVDTVVRNQGGQQERVAVPVPLPAGVSERAAPRAAYVRNVPLGPAPATASPVMGSARLSRRSADGPVYGGTGYGRGYGGRGRIAHRQASAPVAATEPSIRLDGLLPGRRSHASGKAAREAGEELGGSGDADRTGKKARPKKANWAELAVVGSPQVSGLRSTIERTQLGEAMARLVREVGRRLGVQARALRGRFSMTLHVGADGRITSLRLAGHAAAAEPLRTELQRLLVGRRLTAAGSPAKVHLLLVLS